MNQLNGRPTTRYVRLIDPSGSMTVGHVAWYSATNWRAGSGGSSVRTPTIARPSAAWASSSRISWGNSSRHGMHDGPQKLTTTGRPRSDASSKVVPSRVVPVMSGAGSPISARPSRVSGCPLIPALTNSHRPTWRDVTFASDRYWTVAVPVMFGWIVQTYW